MKKVFYFLLSFWMLFSSCAEKEKHLRLVKVSEYSSFKVTDTSLVDLIKMKTGIDIGISYTLSSDRAIKMLEDKEADLVILPNNTRSSKTDIRTLLPLLPRFFVILTNKNVDTMSVKHLFERGEIYFEDLSRLDSLLFKRLYFNFNIDEHKINAHLSDNLSLKPSDSLKVYVGLIHGKNHQVLNLTDHNWHFYSLGHIENYGKGSRVEGFTMMNSSTYPFIIPRSIYGGIPRKAVLTFAINDMLVCRKDLDASDAYAITKTIIENKAKLIEMDNVYNLLRFDFKSQVLSFPIHRGTQKYLDREKPPVWFKYVKMVWPILSISVVFFGMFASFRKNLKKRKKQKIEMYYNKLLEIRDRTDEANELQSYIKLLSEVKMLRAEAMKSLARKKLDPGESFNIFLAMYNEIRSEIADNIRELRLKERSQNKKND